MIHAPHWHDFWFFLLITILISAGLYVTLSPAIQPAEPAALTIDLTPMEKYCTPTWEKAKRKIVNYDIYISTNCGKKYKAIKGEK